MSRIVPGPGAGRKPQVTFYESTFTLFKAITVTGLRSRANWDTDKYMGCTQRKVTLQYRKKVYVH
ncbi:hypothetical protein [Streptomyces sp. NBC_01236]|uniref:hypothetical protein n=1 Tax=Streptomyces sp. NBC_01236 TaxID=2903789 RepID=UPI002E1322F1|nr:hypothetical protein OG324_33915 [Streptomyces sp. NBC_01236]